MDDKIKILIAEDDRLIQGLYKIGLADDLFDLKFADDGETALEIYNSWQPDIILLDIRLPLLTGYSLLKEIREEYKDKITTIIMATALSEKADIVDCIHLGVQGYLIKPFNYKELTIKVLDCHYQKKQ